MIGSIRRPRAQNPRISKRYGDFKLSPKARAASRSQSDISGSPDPIAVEGIGQIGDGKPFYSSRLSIV